MADGVISWLIFASLLLVNLLDFLLDFRLAPRASLELLNSQPEPKVLVGILLLHVSQQFLKKQCEMIL